MRRTLPMAMWVLFMASGGMGLLWGLGRMPFRGSASLQAAEAAPRKKFNLHLWVPEEELKVWDPVNVNVNPVPWRVYGAKRDDGVRTSLFRHTAIGKSVRVEGIAWGYDVETDLPTSRVIFEGGTVMVRGEDFNRPEIRGKCVRVIGTLRLGTKTRRGFDLQYPNYYYIDATTYDVLEQVGEPKVILQTPAP